jgi:hypothetical protein
MLADISHNGQKKEKEIQDVCGRIAVLYWGVKESSKISGSNPHSRDRGKFNKVSYKVNTCLNKF